MAVQRPGNSCDPIEILPTRGRVVLNAFKGAMLYSQRRFGRGLGLWRAIDIGSKIWTNWALCPVLGPDGKPLFIDLRAGGFGITTQGYGVGEIIPLLDYFANDAIVLDIGSNIGVWSRLFAARVPLGKVYAFEPSPSTFKLLAKNCCQFPNIECIPRALGGDNGTVAFREDAPAGMRHLVSNSTSDGSDTMVPVSRLDDWVREAGLTRIDFIKIDVEGLEEELLGGARDTIQRFDPTILFEFLPWMAEERSKFRGRVLFAELRKLGYRSFRVDKFGSLFEDFMTPEDWTNDYLAVSATSRFQPAVDKLLKR